MAEKFTIPRKQRQEEQVLREVDKSSREYREVHAAFRQMLSTLATSSEALELSCIEVVDNASQSDAYQQRRKAMRSSGYSIAEMAEHFYCLPVCSRAAAAELCKKGLSTGSQTMSCLGNPELGVYIYKDVKAARQSYLSVPPNAESKCILVLFRVTKGRVKTVLEGQEEPTPNYDCHVSKRSASEHIQSLSYMYEFGETAMLETPRQCYPFAVLYCSNDPACLGSASPPFQVPVAKNSIDDVEPAQMLWSGAFITDNGRTRKRLFDGSLWTFDGAVPVCANLRGLFETKVNLFGRVSLTGVHAKVPPVVWKNLIGNAQSHSRGNFQWLLVRPDNDAEDPITRLCSLLDTTQQAAVFRPSYSICLYFMPGHARRLAGKLVALFAAFSCNVQKILPEENGTNGVGTPGWSSVNSGAKGHGANSPQNHAVNAALAFEWHPQCGLEQVNRPYPATDYWHCSAHWFGQAQYMEWMPGQALIGQVHGNMMPIGSAVNGQHPVYAGHQAAGGLCYAYPAEEPAGDRTTYDGSGHVPPDHAVPCQGQIASTQQTGCEQHELDTASPFANDNSHMSEQGTAIGCMSSSTKESHVSLSDETFDESEFIADDDMSLASEEDGKLRCTQSVPNGSCVANPCSQELEGSVHTVEHESNEEHDGRPGHLTIEAGMPSPTHLGISMSASGSCDAHVSPPSRRMATTAIAICATAELSSLTHQGQEGVVTNAYGACASRDRLMEQWTTERMPLVSRMELMSANEECVLVDTCHSEESEEPVNYVTPQSYSLALEADVRRQPCQHSALPEQSDEDNVTICSSPVRCMPVAKNTANDCRDVVQPTTSELSAIDDLRPNALLMQQAQSPNKAANACTDPVAPAQNLSSDLIRNDPELLFQQEVYTSKPSTPAYSWSDTPSSVEENSPPQSDDSGIPGPLMSGESISSSSPVETHGDNSSAQNVAKAHLWSAIAYHLRRLEESDFHSVLVQDKQSVLQHIERALNHCVVLGKSLCVVGIFSYLLEACAVACDRDANVWCQRQNACLEAQQISSSQAEHKLEMESADVIASPPSSHSSDWKQQPSLGAATLPGYDLKSARTCGSPKLIISEKRSWQDCSQPEHEVVSVGLHGMEQGPSVKGNVRTSAARITTTLHSTAGDSAEDTCHSSYGSIQEKQPPRQGSQTPSKRSSENYQQKLEDTDRYRGRGTTCFSSAKTDVYRTGRNHRRVSEAAHAVKMAKASKASQSSHAPCDRHSSERSLRFRHSSAGSREHRRRSPQCQASQSSSTNPGSVSTGSRSTRALKSDFWHSRRTVTYSHRSFHQSKRRDSSRMNSRLLSPRDLYDSSDSSLRLSHFSRKATGVTRHLLASADRSRSRDIACSSDKQSRERKKNMTGQLDRQHRREEKGVRWPCFQDTVGSSTSKLSHEHERHEGEKSKSRRQSIQEAEGPSELDQTELDRHAAFGQSADVHNKQVQASTMQDPQRASLARRVENGAAYSASHKYPTAKPTDGVQAKPKPQSSLYSTSYPTVNPYTMTSASQMGQSPTTKAPAAKAAADSMYQCYSSKAKLSDQDQRAPVVSISLPARRKVLLQASSVFAHRDSDSEG